MRQNWSDSKTIKGEKDRINIPYKLIKLDFDYKHFDFHDFLSQFYL